MSNLARYAVFALAFVAIGCGDSGRCRVSGNVTFEGRPLPMGTMTFIPIAPGEPNRTAGFCRIESGRFDSGKGRNPMPGPHRVLIAGFDGVPYTERVGDVVETAAEGRPLFPNYSQDVDIPRKQQTSIDFTVPTMPPLVR